MDCSMGMPIPPWGHTVDAESFFACSYLLSRTFTKENMVFLAGLPSEVAMNHGIWPSGYFKISCMFIFLW